MNRGFSVSVWARGVLPPAEDNNRVVVTARHPACTSISNNKTAARDVYVVFSGGRIFRAPQRPSTALSQNDSVCCTPCSQTLVVFGDPGSCSVGSGDGWDELFSFLLQEEGAWENSLLSDGQNTFQKSRKQHQQLQRNLTDFPSAAPGAATHSVAAGPASRVSDTNESELLKVLGPCRAAYARRVSAALSGRCRWRSQVDQKSCGVGRPTCSCMHPAIPTFPSAAFCLVYHSESFGLLFFCRDKLGLASLLAVGPSNDPSELLPNFVLATSATNLRSSGLLSGLERGVKGRVIEVPVDGVWLLDLWALADPLLFPLGDSDTPASDAEAPPAVDRMSLECTEESEHCSASFFTLPSVYCIPWEQPSIIRTTHMWCRCAACQNFQEHFWKRKSCQCCLQIGWHEGPLPQDVDFSLGKRLWSKLGLSDAPTVPHALEKTNFCGTGQRGGSSCLSSAEVLKSLYRELYGAVARAIPEALQRITGTSGPSVSGAAPEMVFVGLLFSGGVDSTLLAGMILRVLAAAMAKTRPAASEELAHHAALHQRVVVVELISVGFSAEAPDRLTALRSFQDLLRLLHSLGERHESQTCRASAEVTPLSKCVAVIGGWALELRLVAVDVPYRDIVDCRSQLLEVISPKRSHMDLNIAAPLYFSSRGIGYLVSPHFDKSGEWKLLLKDSSLWKELLIRPLFRPSRRTCHPEKRTHHAGTGSTAAPGQAVEPEKVSAVSTIEQQQQVRVVCRVCRRQAKSGCAHSACKLCCAKLQASALQRVSTSDPHTQDCDEIHVGGQGRLRIADLYTAVHTACPVHRKPWMLCAKEDAGKKSETDACSEGQPRGGDAVVPFKSLSVLPCGVPLATSEVGRPFMAMHLAELNQWCAQDERRWRCVDRVTGTYTVQSTVFLMGSGADEIFGGYGRHRTANLTKGWEALRHEQILDLKRLWFRNMGRDCRALSAFGRWARVPFLDERLLNFVCCSVPFEHIVRPSADVYAEVEETMRHLLMRATPPTHIASGDELNCRSASSKLTNLLEAVQEPTVASSDHCTAAGGGGKGQVEQASASSDLCSGNKWLIRLCAAVCGLSFSVVAKKRAMQFGSRSAKVSNREYFPSNRKARGDASLESCEETHHY